MSERRRRGRTPNIIDEYIEFFSGYSVHNEMYARLSFHVLLGQLTKHIRVRIKRGYDDNRISLLYLAPSGTGKSAAADVYGDIAESLEFKNVEVDDYSDRAVVGTVKEKEDAPGEYEVLKGFLEYADIVHADEAEVLFLPSRYAPRTKTFIQKSLNAIGSRSNRVTRQVGGSEVIVTPTCSYIFTTFPPEDDKAVSDMIQNGILQRTAFFPRLMSDGDWMIMSDEIINGIVNPDAEIDYNVTAETIGIKLDSIRLKYENVEHIPVERNLTTFFKNCRNSMIDFIISHNGVNVIGDEKMKTYVNRYIVLTTKFATHYAMVLGRDTVNRSCMEYGWNIVQFIFKDAYEWVDSKTSPGRKFEEFTPQEYFYEGYKKIQKNEYEGIEEGYVARTDLMDIVLLISKKSEGWFNKHIMDLEGTENIVSIRYGRKKYFKVEQSLRASIEEEQESSGGKKTKVRKRRRKKSKAT